MHWILEYREQVKAELRAAEECEAECGAEMNIEIRRYESAQQTRRHLEALLRAIEQFDASTAIPEAP